MPSLKTFTERLKTLGWSNHNDFYKSQKNKDRVRIVLELIEEHLSGRINFEESSLEHILPDSQDNENALIGNIILLENRINQNCKDKPFREKLNFYRDSNYKMARELANRYGDKEFLPQKRTDFFSKYNI
ncbi:GmrSD restriction endonuclease domain-containing protein [Paraprevotella xylaniphila]|uniref:GmrSD restriction endonuclease domain-containing protein n=1 Tax=Paraprevotella xylaniphila TaxID=454155 RepID=UPI003FD7CC37